MTDEEVRKWMEHPGARRGLAEAVSGLLSAASQTFTEDARLAIEAGVARLVSTAQHAHQWKTFYDGVVAMHNYEVTFRRQLEEQCEALHRRIADLEGFKCQ